MVKKIPKEIYLSGIFVVLVLWQMLLPGYILTLDMVSTPKLSINFGEGSFLNALPLTYCLKFFNILLTGWIIQKIMLIALFFCLFYLAINYLPVPRKYYSNYWAALFYSVNPFVYERFLAGHWTHLFAYALLPLFIHYLFKFAEKPNWRKSASLFGSLFLISIFSLHFFVMAIFILIIYSVSQLAKSLIDKNLKFTENILKFCLILGFIFLVSCSYWLVPYLFNPNQSIISGFNQQNIEAFRTSGDFRLGTSLNVLALYGIWNENQPWANYWLWPKDNFIFWAIIASMLLVILALGIFFGLKHRDYRAKTIFFLILGILAFIFSCGIGDTIFKPINQWLFGHIFFWRGFRDSQKFSGLIILSYAYFGSLGFYYIINKLQKFRIAKFAMIVLFALPLLYTYPMLGGFARQLQPVWYPKSWNQVNRLLNQDKSNFKVLFLPWHQYLTLKFNHNLITANPAKSFFNQPIIQSENMEVNNILTQAAQSKYQKINNLIFNAEKLPATSIINQLKANNIKYIIFAQDLITDDNVKYVFLNSTDLTEIYSSPEIKLFYLNQQ
jgi:hypothetical protein